MGTLPNGLRYYLRVNKAPAHRAEFRLAVNAGSVLEDPDQRGFAHFLEHMAFNGTTHFPHNSLVDFIEKSGMRFGDDLNAITTYDETVYQFTLPSDDSKLVSHGLDILQDWASGGITIDSSEVAAERGVVMGEWRLRSLVDTATQNFRDHFDSLNFGDSPYFAREPIGDTLLLTTAQSAPIRRFYRDWYRPDLMAIVVVGDFDRATMLREITRRFGSIAARKNARPRIVPSVRTERGPVVDVYEGLVNPSVEVLWPAPAEPREPEAALRQAFVERLLTQVLQQRLFAIRGRPSRPFITATLEKGRLARAFPFVGVSLIAWPDSLERGLATVLTEIQRITQHGVPATTLTHEKEALLRNLEGAAGSTLSRPSGTYADDYVQHYLTSDVTLLSPTQELRLARTLLPAITSEELAGAAQKLWGARDGERFLVQLPRFSHVRPPTHESILAIVDSVSHTTVPPESETTLANGSLLTRLPTPGRITRERVDSAAGITLWTLSNGARVILKPTANDPDELLLRAWSPGGFSRMPDSLFFTPGRMVARLMTDAAGLGSQSRDALQRQLETTGLKKFRVHIGYADESIDLAGSPKELETLFQLLHLQFTAPKLDTATIRSWASLAKYQGNGATVQDEVDQQFARGEPRLWPPTTQLAELVRPDQALAVYRDRFGNAGDFTFILVGAITPAQARPLVERYLASLPATGEHETVKPLDAKPYLPRIEETRRGLELPQARTSVLFDGTMPSTPNEYLKARRQLDALMTVLRGRVRTRIREELGGDYSPQIGAFTYALPEAGQPTEHYRVIGGFLSAPERMRALWKEYAGILDSVRAHGATPAELERASTIQRRQHETALEENSYWLDMIQTYDRLGIPVAKIVDPYGKAPMTPSEMKVAAEHYLPSDVYIHVTLMPQDSTLYTKSDSAKSDGASSDSTARALPAHLLSRQ